MEQPSQAVVGPLERTVRRLPAWRRHGAEYVHADPFQGGEAELKCRTVTLRKARKNYLCYGLTGKQDHGIQAGDYYRYERARVDGTFWSEYRICLGCMDAFIEGRY
jgi:hypothetical protein